MRNKSGGPKKSFGKRSDSGDKKSFGKGKSSFSGKGKEGKSFDSKGSSFSKRHDSSASGEGKPKRKFSSEDFGGKTNDRSNSYAKSFDKGSDKGSYGKKRDYSDKDSSYEKKPKKDFGDKYSNKPRSKGGSDSYSTKPKNKDFYEDEKPKREYGDKKPYSKRDSDSSYEKKSGKSFGDKKEYGKGKFSSSDKPKREYGDKKPYSKRDSDSSYEKKSGESFGDKKEYGKGKFSSSDKPKREYGDKKPYSKRGSDLTDEKRSYLKRDSGSFEKKDGKSFSDKKPFGAKRSFSDEGTGKKHRVSKRNFEDKSERSEKPAYDKKNKDRVEGKRPRIEKKSFSKSNPEDEGKIRLNKYLSNSGICSRRDADKLIESGAVTVNGKIVSELGYKISPEDVVNYGGGIIKREKKVYVLLNKPKDYITTLDDPEGRKTVMELVKNAGKERIYPVGRLDRNTTGLLMLTNDGDMAMKLTHPKHQIQKMYAVSIDKSIKPEDLKALHEGFELEDGFIKADHVELVGEGSNRKEIGIEIHSGRNRIVRRMFEHLGYNVVKLDRVMFAGLTKKDLPRGKWRFLSEKEISFLRMVK